ncbi:MAG: hypothetical protein IJU99_01960 [Lachnospiraceae bacterium]|nr:hypothetical protein [Lachnospiraceae bacterium]
MKIGFRRVCAILLAVILVLPLSACGAKGPGPDEAVKEFCEAMKAFDLEKLSKGMGKEGENPIEAFSSEDDMDQMLLEQMKTWAAEIEYKIGKPEIDKDKAKVPVEFQALDAGPVITATMSEFILKIFSLAMSGGSEDEMAAALKTILSEKVAGTTLSKVTTNAEFTLEKGEEGWVITKTSDEVAQVLTSHVLEAMEKMDEEEGELLPDDDEEETDEEVTKGAEDETESETEPATKGASGDYHLDETTLIDNDICLVKITDCKEDAIWGFVIDVYCENKTADKKLMFSAGDSCVNGYKKEAYWAEDVPAGKKANSQIAFPDLEDIGSVAEMVEFTITVRDSDDWAADPFAEESFKLFPTGLDEASVKVPERKKTADEQVIVDNDNVTLVLYGLKDDSYGKVIGCFVENKTDKKLMFSMTDGSVNGYVCEPYWAVEIPGARRTYSNIVYMKDELEKNQITEIEEIEFTLRVYDPEDWSAGAVMEETYQVKMK